MPVRLRADALRHLGGAGKIPGGILSSLEYHRDDGPSTDRSGKFGGR